MYATEVFRSMHTVELLIVFLCDRVAIEESHSSESRLRIRNELLYARTVPLRGAFSFFGMRETCWSCLFLVAQTITFGLRTNDEHTCFSITPLPRTTAVGSTLPFFDIKRERRVVWASELLPIFRGL